MATIKCIYNKPYCRWGRKRGWYCEDYDEIMGDCEIQRRDECRYFTAMQDGRNCLQFKYSTAQFEKDVKSYEYTGEQLINGTCEGYLQIGRLKIQNRYIVYLEIDGRVLADYREEEE